MFYSLALSTGLFYHLLTQATCRFAILLDPLFSFAFILLSAFSTSSLSIAISGPSTSSHFSSIPLCSSVLNSWSKYPPHPFSICSSSITIFPFLSCTITASPKFDFALSLGFAILKIFPLTFLSLELLVPGCICFSFSPFYCFPCFHLCFTVVTCKSSKIVVTII